MLQVDHAHRAVISAGIAESRSRRVYKSDLHARGIGQFQLEGRADLRIRAALEHRWVGYPGGAVSVYFLVRRKFLVGLVGLAGAHQDLAEIVMSGGVVGLVPNHFPEVIDRIVK